MEREESSGPGLRPIPSKWAGKTWTVKPGPWSQPVIVTIEQVERVYAVIARTAPEESPAPELCRIFPNCGGLSDRRVDRALQLLKKEALIGFYCPKGERRRWLAIGEWSFGQPVNYTTNHGASWERFDG